VRLLLARDGSLQVSSAPVAPPKVARVAFAAEPVDETDVFLYHKTTHRDVYDRARAARPDCDDVILWNRRGEITESSVANLVVEVDGAALTPNVACGLLGGTLRAELLATGVLQEARLTKDDLRRATSLRLINSIRKWIDVEFVN
jgi:para-aminobenzoate synthetase/4-amino-4-deoxychorismate lyase